MSGAAVPLHRLGAKAALALMASGEADAADFARAAAARVAAREGEVGAWAHFDPHALARRAEAAVAGALGGLLVGVKDNFDTADMPTAYGSRFYEGHRPVADAAAVAMLKAQGAIVAGKTVCTEFAGWPIPRTRNPLRHALTPGGSSSGSAAAVADRMIPVALGTQTLGSVIRPASYCGIFGFKPSFGRISRVGLKPLAESLDTVGVLAREIDDAALIYRALSGDERRAAGTAPRIHVCRGLNWDLADEDAKAAFEGFVAKLRGAAALADWDYPEDFTRLADAARTIHDFEVYRGFTFERMSAPEKLSPAFRQGLERARHYTVGAYEQAVELGHACRDRFADEIGDGVVITLSTRGEAPAHETGTGDPVMNSSWTLLHAASATVPVLTGATGMPVGLQIAAPRFRDAEVLQAAAWLQDLTHRL